MSTQTLTREKAEALARAWFDKVDVLENHRHIWRQRRRQRRRRAQTGSIYTGSRTCSIWRAIDVQRLVQFLRQDAP